MKTGEFVIKRITKNHVRGHRRSEKVSRNFIKEIPLEGNAEILERKVLAINTASPGVVPNSRPVIVISPAVRAEKAKTELVTPEVTQWGRWRWCHNLF